MFKIISFEVGLASATWLGSNALKWCLVEARNNHVSRVLSAQPTHATNIFLKLWYNSIVQCIIDNCFPKNTSASCQKCAWTYFYPVANKGLIKTIMTTSRIYLMTQAILLHTKRCKMYRVYCLNYILNKSQVNIGNTNSVTSLLRCSQLFVECVQIIKYL